jgi:hypothetical protein
MFWAPGCSRRWELGAITQKSCSILNGLRAQIEWVQSYLTEDKLYCLYVPPNEELIREHARRGGFPAKVTALIGPTRASGRLQDETGFLENRD